MNAIKESVRAAGSHWFDPDTMRFFRCRVGDQVYQGPGGVYFVTSEKYSDTAARKYSVRQFTSPDKINTIGEFNSLTRQQAHKLAAEKAGDGGTVTADAFRPVTVLEQFAADLRKHGNGKATAAQARRLMALAKEHHRLCELWCSDEQYNREIDEDGEHPRMVRCRAAIEKLAKACGCKGVEFSGDPRGCTVKLVFHDGETNDFGKEGWCVPIDD